MSDVRKMTSEQHWSVGCHQFTVQVNTEGREQRITWAAPIVNRFTGQTLNDLKRWIERRIGKCTIYEITPEEQNANPD